MPMLLWKKEDFVEIVMKYGSELSADKFSQLISHLELWATERCKNKHREKRRCHLH